MRRAWKLLAIALVGLIGGGILGVRVAELQPSQTPRPFPPVPPSLLEPYETTILVLGTDATGGDARDSLNSLTDTMLLVHVDSGAHHLAVISIPRDTRVMIPGHGTCKINAANVYGGAVLAKQTVSRLLGVPIDHYLLLNLRGVRELVRAMGGMDIKVPKPLRYVDHAGKLRIDLPAGRHHLDGNQVESYLRFRHDDAGDIGRIQRQQAFLNEFVRQFLKPRMLLRLPTLWDVFLSHGRTDLSGWQIASIVGSLKALDPLHDLELTMLPGFEDASSGPWYWRANPEALETFLVRHFHKPSSN